MFILDRTVLRKIQINSYCCYVKIAMLFSKLLSNIDIASICLGIGFCYCFTVSYSCHGYCRLLSLVFFLYAVRVLLIGVICCCCLSEDKREVTRVWYGSELFKGVWLGLDRVIRLVGLVVIMLG